jgi:hypothetical protein
MMLSPSSSNSSFASSLLLVSDFIDLSSFS